MFTGVGAGAPSRGSRRPLVVTNNFTMGLRPYAPIATEKAACAAAFIVHHKAGRCCLRVGHHDLQPKDGVLLPIP